MFFDADKYSWYGKLVGVMHLDILKAFDFVQHAVLIKKNKTPKKPNKKMKKKATIMILRQ